jgi:hypothetical protein
LFSTSSPPVSTSLERFGVHSREFAWLIVTMPSSSKEGKPKWRSRSTMVLSEARGLWLFLVIRGGIT